VNGNQTDVATAMTTMLQTMVDSRMQDYYVSASNAQTQSKQDGVEDVSGTKLLGLSAKTETTYHPQKLIQITDEPILYASKR
jgi:hypothetical protein